MSEKANPIQYVEAALAKPGRGAWIAFVAALVAWAWVGADLIRPVLSDFFRSIAWMTALGAPIVGVVLALLHYANERKRQDPIPEFEVPTFGKPLASTSGAVSTTLPSPSSHSQGAAIIREPTIRPQIVDASTVSQPSPGTPQAKREAEAKAKAEGERQAHREQQRAEVAAALQAAEQRRLDALRAEFEDHFEQQRAEQEAAKEMEEQRKRDIETKLDVLPDNAIEKLRWIRDGSFDAFDAHSQTESLVRLTNIGFLSQLLLGDGRSRYCVTQEGKLALPLIDEVRPVSTPQDASIWAKAAGETRVVMPEETTLPQQAETQPHANSDTPPGDHGLDTTAKLRKTIGRLSKGAQAYLQYIHLHDVRTLRTWSDNRYIQELCRTGFLVMSAAGDRKDTFRVPDAARNAMKTIIVPRRVFEYHIPPWDDGDDDAIYYPELHLGDVHQPYPDHGLKEPNPVGKPSKKDE